MTTTEAERRTESGEVLGEDERLDPRRPLELFLTWPTDPGGAPRVVALGASANLCLLDRPLARVLEAPSSRFVVCTIIEGRVVFSR